MIWICIWVILKAAIEAQVLNDANEDYITETHKHLTALYLELTKNVLLLVLKEEVALSCCQK